jgi:hypothetical protein
MLGISELIKKINEKMGKRKRKRNGKEKEKVKVNKKEKEKENMGGKKKHLFIIVSDI